MVNKKGWIRIVEAFMAIVFLGGVVLLVMSNQSSISQSDISSQVHDAELAILREIQLNDTLRNSVISVNLLPAEWNDSQFPQDIKIKILNREPNYLDCVAKICDITDDCTYLTTLKQDIYSESVIITVTISSTTYQSRKLKLFCWSR